MILELMETVEKQERFITEAGNKSSAYGRARSDFGISADSVASVIRRAKKVI
jgi:hypothetical protein